MKKQYLAEVKYKDYLVGQWVNVGGKLFGKRYLSTLEEAEKAIQQAVEEYQELRTVTNYVGSIGISHTIDERTRDVFTVVEKRIRVREVTEWEVVK